MSETIQSLLQLSVLIALGFLVAVAFYESLCKRDVLVARTMRLARRASSRPWVAGVTYVASVAVGIPILVIVWAVVLELILLVIGSTERIGSLALTAVSIVAAARILAYIREATAHELAKAIPLSMAFLLITGGATNLESNLAALLDDPTPSALTPEMVGFLIVLEVGLRLTTDGATAMLAAVRRRRGSDSELGVWRTIAAGLRRMGRGGAAPEDRESS